MEDIHVQTPLGMGCVWGIGPGVVLVEIEPAIIAFSPEQVMVIEPPEMAAIN